MDITETKCPKCNSPRSYSEEYDTYYCETCNEWLEDICTDRDCVYCNTRPIFPKEQV
jgi:DNA-directed RNA polymerase subunit RPC12/RpoP